MTLDVAIRHRLGDFAVDASFSAPPGVTALFGHSGSGKTTIVNAVAGLLRPDDGQILVNGDVVLDTRHGIEVPVHRRRVGYVFQDARLFPHLTVRQNLDYGRWFARLSRGGPAFDRVVDLLGIGQLLARRPGNLSGGEKQRVAIGRALLAEPRILLMDEPLAALDDARKAEILPYLERLRDDVAIPMLYVSHAVPEVARLATTIVAMADGRVVRQGAAGEMLSDPDAFPLMGRQEAGSILTATIAGQDPRDGLTDLAFSGGRLTTPRIAAPVGARVRLRIRARDIIIALKPPEETSALNVLPAVVKSVGGGEGAIVDVALTLGSDDLLARITRRSLGRLGLAPGTRCYAILKSIAMSRRDVGLIADDT